MYPAASFSPMARPRPRGPTRSIFMFTVIDQASPWLTPSSTLAATIQPHAGAYASRNGTGSPAAHPATNRVLRVCRAVSGPVARLATALVTPNAMMKLKTARYPDRWNTRVPTRLVVARSRPTIPPTNTFTTTSSVNCGQFAASPSRTAGPAGTGARGAAVIPAPGTRQPPWPGHQGRRTATSAAPSQLLPGGPGRDTREPPGLRHLLVYAALRPGGRPSSASNLLF